MPRGSVTTPAMLPESWSAVAAVAMRGSSRLAIPNNSAATDLCVFVLNIRRSFSGAEIPQLLEYRKLGRRSKHLISVLVRNFQLDRVLPRSQGVQRQHLLNRHLAGGGVRNLRNLLRKLE